jgi:hypothetical protein
MAGDNPLSENGAVATDTCVVCGAERHPQAYACTRCKRILDRFETRRDASGGARRLYTAISRHVVLVMAASAICAVTAAWLRDRTDTQAPPPASPDAAPPADPGLIPLTIREIRRLLADALARPKPPGHAARWLQWRRRHQARSRWFHKHARPQRNYALVS